MLPIFDSAARGGHTSYVPATGHVLTNSSFLFSVCSKVVSLLYFIVCCGFSSVTWQLHITIKL